MQTKMRNTKHLEEGQNMFIGLCSFIIRRGESTGLGLGGEEVDKRGCNSCKQILIWSREEMHESAKYMSISQV